MAENKIKPTLQRLKDLQKKSVLADGNLEALIQKLDKNSQQELAKILMRKVDDSRDLIALVAEKKMILEKAKEVQQKAKLVRNSLIFSLLLSLILGALTFGLTLFLGFNLLEPFFDKIDDNLLLALQNTSLVIMPPTLIFCFAFGFYGLSGVLKERTTQRPKLSLLERTILKKFAHTERVSGEFLKSEKMVKIVQNCSNKLKNVDAKSLGKALKKLGYLRIRTDKEGYCYCAKQKKKWIIL